MNAHLQINPRSTILYPSVNGNQQNIEMLNNFGIMSKLESFFSEILFYVLRQVKKQFDSNLCCFSTKVGYSNIDKPTSCFGVGSLGIFVHLATFVAFAFGLYMLQLHEVVNFWLWSVWQWNLIVTLFPLLLVPGFLISMNFVSTSFYYKGADQAPKTRSHIGAWQAVWIFMFLTGYFWSLSLFLWCVRFIFYVSSL